MASFTGVGDNVELSVPRRGENYTVALSGTYNMRIDLQRKVGDGAWQTVKKYTTANATVADTFSATMENEVMRLIVVVDTSGTCTATLTAVSGEILQTIKDPFGNTLYQIIEGGIILPTRTPVTLTAATTLTREKHAFRPLLLSAAAGFQVTMPAATASGDEYHFYVVTASTSNAYVINAFDSSTTGDINGVIVGVDPPGDEFTWGAQGTENQISLGGTSNATGGFVGDYVKLVDIKAGVWHAHGMITQDGTEATPFGTDS